MFMSGYIPPVIPGYFQGDCEVRPFTGTTKILLTASNYSL